MVWYSHLLKNFPQFVVIHTVKGFGIVSKAEVGVFLELSCFFNDPANLENSAVATGQEKVSFHSNPKERPMPKNVQTITQLHSSHMLVK